MRTLLLYASAFFLVHSAASAQDRTPDAPLPVEIVVHGKQPGPPMWRVRNGDNTLYIFAWLSPIPKDIYWESQRVEDVIANAQEYIRMPEAEVSISKLTMLNPINIVRGIGFAKRITRNEDKATLEEVLPADLYARFAAIKARYFPDNKKIERMRPLVAGGQMVSMVQEEAGLVPAGEVGKKIRRLVKRNNDIKVTEVKYETKLDGGYKKITNRVEDMMNSLDWELELSCFERQLTQVEEDVDEMQYRAATWAQGYVQEFKFIPLPGDVDDACTAMVATSSEEELFSEVTGKLDTMWLDAAETALKTNETTFAVLDFSQLLLEHGRLAQLKARGYEVIEP